MAKTIQGNQLTNKAIVMVRGIIEYSHLTSIIEGDELKRRDEENQRRHMQPVGKPYTTITIRDAKIVPVHPESGMTIEEKYVEERMYNSEGDPSIKYHVIDKSPYITNFYQSDGTDIKSGKQFYPEAELANGLDVLLIMQVYQSKTYGSKSIGLTGVVVEEPVRYYTGTVMSSKDLAAAGLVLESTPQPGGFSRQGINQDTVQTQSQPDPVPVSDPVPGQAYSSNPVNNAGISGMNPPIDDDVWICPKCGATVAAGQNFCGQCGCQRPVQQANPYAGTNGIRYQP